VKQEILRVLRAFRRVLRVPLIVQSREHKICRIPGMCGRRNAVFTIGRKRKDADKQSSSFRKYIA
jgi:hypothetical protein